MSSRVFRRLLRGKEFLNCYSLNARLHGLMFWALLSLRFLCCRSPNINGEIAGKEEEGASVLVPFLKFKEKCLYSTHDNHHEGTDGISEFSASTGLESSNLPTPWTARLKPHGLVGVDCRTNFFYSSIPNHCSPNIHDEIFDATFVVVACASFPTLWLDRWRCKQSA
jgi:hypothetical protein